jgi:hypothetical protein
MGETRTLEAREWQAVEGIVRQYEQVSKFLKAETLFYARPLGIGFGPSPIDGGFDVLVSKKWFAWYVTPGEKMKRVEEVIRQYEQVSKFLKAETLFYARPLGIMVKGRYPAGGRFYVSVSEKQFNGSGAAPGPAAEGEAAMEDKDKESEFALALQMLARIEEKLHEMGVEVITITSVLSTEATLMVSFHHALRQGCTAQ